MLPQIGDWLLNFSPGGGLRPVQGRAQSIPRGPGTPRARPGIAPPPPAHIQGGTHKQRTLVGGHRPSRGELLGFHFNHLPLLSTSLKEKSLHRAFLSETAIVSLS